MNEYTRFRQKASMGDRVLTALLIFFIILFIRSVAVALLEAKTDTPVAPVVTVVPATETVRASVPVRLRIPAIGVDANIQPVGQNAKGQMDVPKGENAYQEAGWYSLGVKPGEVGAAVIDGHLDTRSLIDPGVFRRLDELAVGDIVEVIDDNGALFRFRVTGDAVLGAGDDATNVFNSYTGKAHLNLITCTGDWQQDQKQYDKRLVVFTELIQ